MTSFLIIGDAMIDEYVHVRPARRSPEDPGTYVFHVIKTERKPGGCLNVAANVRSLIHPESDAYISTIISKDQSHWMQHVTHIETHWYLANYHGHALTKRRLVDSATRHQLLRVDDPPTYNSGHTLEFAKRLASGKESLDEFDCIIVSDYCKGAVTPKLAEILQEFPVPIFIDTKKEDLRIWKNIPNCFIKINSSEYAKAFNSGKVNLIVTDGANGSVLYPKDGGNCERVAGKPVENANVIGAGDCYLAGLAVGYMEHKLPIVEAMAYADTVARASVRDFGTTVVTPAQLEMERQHDDHGHAR